MLLTASGQKPEMLLNILQFTGQSSARKNYLVLNVNSAKVKKNPNLNIHINIVSVSFSELFINEDCEAKCIMKAKASFQESSSNERILALFMDQKPRELLCPRLHSSGM